MDLAFTVICTLLLLGGIVWACSIFTNAIEWLGHRYNLSEGAVGSVLAAVGTALPETMVPIIAIVGGWWAAQSMGAVEAAQHMEDATHIGVGAILGAPFLLSTLAMFLSGLAVFFFAKKGVRGTVLLVDLYLFKRDLQYFFPAYVFVFLASYLSLPWLKWILGVVLIGLYVTYVYRTLKIEHMPDEEFELEPLMLAPSSKIGDAEPPSWLILLQTFLGLALIFVMAHLFVDQLEHLSTILHLSPLIISLILTPIATELPEKFNSVVWIGKRKDNLALGNITGAMVFQSCIPTAIGLLLTPWVLDTEGLLSVLLCLASAGLLYGVTVYKRTLTAGTLLWGGLFYVLFLVASFWNALSMQPGRAW